MKRIITLMMLLISSLSYSQSTIYNETFGAGTLSTGSTSITSYSYSAAPNKFDIAPLPLQYGGTGTYPNSSNATVVGPNYTGTGYTQSNYIGASGTGTLMLTGLSTSYGYWYITGINTSVTGTYVLQIGAKWTSPSTFKLEYWNQTSGMYVSVPITQPSVNWSILTSATLPNSNNLKLRFTNIYAGSSFNSIYLDDFKIINTTLSVNYNVLEDLLVYPNPMTGDTLYFNDSVQKEISIYDLTGKHLSTTTVTSSLIIDYTPGTYVIDVTINNKRKVLKLIKKQ